MSNVGEILRNARQRKHLSLQDVSRATCIRLPYLEALENGEYGVLPGPAYVTGFLRNYAKVVGLHPDDIVQEYFASRPLPEPTVKPATRVLANGHSRQMRSRILWPVAALLLLLAGGYAVKEYSDASARAYSPPLNVTAQSLGAATGSKAPSSQMPHIVHLQLRAVAPVWVRVTADGRRVFQGILQPRAGLKSWAAHHSIYTLTFDGTHIYVRFDGHHMGPMATRPGAIVTVAVPSSWRRVS